MIDKITCLSYDKRKDMWNPLKEQVERIFEKPLEMFVGGDGQDRDVEYDHIDEQPPAGFPFMYTLNKGHYNAFLCHRKMAQRAIDEKVRNVLFLEDDAYIVEDRAFFVREQKFTDFLNRNDWDICYLGWWQKKTWETTENRYDLEELYKLAGIWNISPIDRPPEVAHEICALHGLLINSHFLPVIANAPTGPIDSYLNHNFERINAYFLWPKLIHVHSTFSYCEGSFTEREKI